MRLYFKVKQAGSRKNFIAKEEIVLECIPTTLRELIKCIVTKNVKEFNENIKKERLVDYLTNKEIENRAEAGKVSFGSIYNESKQDLGKALDSAYLAYEDGIYKVFVGDKEAGKLDEEIELKDADTLTFIKFTMLAGRLW
ncbi:hypothetical protein B0P06_003969 [Clostridium saccharoperbutylacetonicum]|uniref:Uncharacterized protein n=1 Tax=Clostridium saccharoperbutylacetonicum N1-4(HMT) TaxID=931276 RepID=M1MSP0_9CLOT|nr:hypothetical protein [Clostridium saccharoperbutylacetonicum]AGF57726.1 hypothetical protein Cspa_c39690 [Clostridium saccharoperbutylacetonicum N1-4(HMT)]NRT61506.1 hypothetical protein [Clostridium saccharoperbutylacetonicum]NSB24828.1 hypothetical protein [Clostridium saccharoperbutylacetonicum]NSB44198.1 hypothetical protein [Clostridium saccharoperbutylacetonicum]